MKRILLSVVMMVILSGSSFAQEISEWRFGLKVLPSVTWLSTSLKEFENGKPRMNFGYGLMVEKKVFKSTSLATGLLVNDFSANYTYTGTDRKVTFKGQNDSIQFISRKLMLKYVELPVALKFRTPEINYITYTAHFGINMGFRVKSTADENFRYAVSGKTGVYDAEPVNNDINFMKLGLDVGLGGEYSIAGSTSLTVGLSYINGFTNITRKEAELLIYDDDNKVKQIFYGHSILLSVGILF